jgi:G3E family GTPase
MPQVRILSSRLFFRNLRETMRQLPGHVYLAKGVIYTTDAPQRRAVSQVVGRRVDISLQNEWGKQTPGTQILAIGAANDMDAAMLSHQVNMVVEPHRGAETAKGDV